MEHESCRDTNRNTVTKGLVQRLEYFEIVRRVRRDHSNYSIIKLEQNPKKSPGDLSRLAVSQTPVRNHQLTMV